MLSRENPAGLETERIAYNADIVGNAAGADSVVNFDTPANGLGCPGCANQTSTYFNIDKIHFRDMGEYNVVVPAMQAVLP